MVGRLTEVANDWVDAKSARLLGNVIAGIAESGARVLLAGEDGWTPESLGRELGRLAAAAQAAV